MLLLQSDFNDKEQERADLFSEFDDLDAQKVSDNSTQDIEKKNAAYNADIDEVIARYATNDFKVYVTGQPRILNAYFISTNKNLKKSKLMDHRDYCRCTTASFQENVRDTYSFR